MVYTSYRGKEELESDKLNMFRYNLPPFVFRSDNMEILQEGQEVQLWENAFFTGDSYLLQYDLIANFPKSNKEDAVRTIERIKEHSVGCELYPGHGNVVYA